MDQSHEQVLQAAFADVEGCWRSGCGPDRFVFEFESLRIHFRRHPQANDPSYRWRWHLTRPDDGVNSHAEGWAETLEQAVAALKCAAQELAGQLAAVALAPSSKRKGYSKNEM